MVLRLASFIPGSLAEKTSEDWAYETSIKEMRAKQIVRDLSARTPKSKAWLLLWEGGPHTALEDQVAAILPSRWSYARVSDAMWLIYHLRECSLSGLADVSHNGANAVFRLQWDYDVAHIGCQPTLIATQVEGLQIETDPNTGIETLHYVRPPLYEVRRGVWPPEVKEVRGKLPCSIIRTRTGPLSNRRLSGKPSQ